MDDDHGRQLGDSLGYCVGGLEVWSLCCFLLFLVVFFTLSVSSLSHPLTNNTPSCSKTETRRRRGRATRGQTTHRSNGVGGCVWARGAPTNMRRAHGLQQECSRCSPPAARPAPTQSSRGGRPTETRLVAVQQQQPVFVSRRPDKRRECTGCVGWAGRGRVSGCSRWLLGRLNSIGK